MRFLLAGAAVLLAQMSYGLKLNSHQASGSKASHELLGLNIGATLNGVLGPVLNLLGDVTNTLTGTTCSVIEILLGPDGLVPELLNSVAVAVASVTQSVLTTIGDGTMAIDDIVAQIVAQLQVSAQQKQQISAKLSASLNVYDDGGDRTLSAD